MKRLSLIVLPLLLISGCSKPISEETLIDKDGLKYHPETKELYSGETIKLRLGGIKEFGGSYKDGKKEGLWTWWYESGEKWKETTFKDGIEDGKHNEWYKNGPIQRKGTYKVGERYGLWTSWYENGQKQFEGTWNDEGEDGLHNYWYENGQKKFENTFKDGQGSFDNEKMWNKDGSRVEFED